MELKTIQIDKVLANFTQPRETFEKEKIKELSESILSNGLINPISVRVWKDKFMIVAGERRWRASKLAGLKTIQAFVKEYKNDGEWMIESLIENVHRENLNIEEKGKYLRKIMEIQKISNLEQLSKLVKINRSQIEEAFSLLEEKPETKKAFKEGKIGVRQITHISQIEDKKTKDEVTKKVIKEELGQIETQKLVHTIQKAQPEVKKALLDDKISVEQAERISKLQKPEQRVKAIQEHKNIAMVSEHIERNIKNVETAKDKREFDKRLIQVKNWIASYRYSITDVHSAIEKSLKILMVNAKLYIPIMDDEQKEKFNEQLDRELEMLERAEHIIEQIKEKIK